MRYHLLLALVSAAAYASAASAAALTVTVAWPRWRDRLAGLAAEQRAHVLAALRFAPAACGSACGVALAGVFTRFEPRDTVETPGALLVLSAAAAIGCAAVGLRRLVSSVRGEARCARLLRHCGRRLDRVDGVPLWIVEASYPVAAIAGLVRPRVLISSGLLQECPPGELAAILRHEGAHLRRRDNLVRAAMQCVPDPLLFAVAGREIQQAWAAAAEQAADDEASGTTVESRTELASALVRVARLAERERPSLVPGMPGMPGTSVLAFYEGTNLEDRVRRLLSPGERRPRPFAAVVLALITGTLSVAVVATESLARHVHAAMESAVRYLP